MSSTAKLTLYTAHETHREAIGTLETDLVKAVQLGTGSLLLAPGFEPSGNDKTFTLTTDKPVAERVRSFFERIIVNQEPQDYDCNSFAAFAIGAEDNIRRVAKFKHQYVTVAPVAQNELQSGAAYGIVQEVRRLGSKVAHVVLGIDSRWHNLSVLGRGGPGYQYGKLAITNTAHLKRHYRGNYIAPYMTRDEWRRRGSPTR